MGAVHADIFIQVAKGAVACKVGRYWMEIGSLCELRTNHVVSPWDE